MKRVTDSFTDSKDPIFVEAFFELVDTDKDGFITYEEVAETAEEFLTPCISESAFEHLVTNTTEEGTKFSKEEFMEVVKKHYR